MKVLLVVYDNDSYIHWFPQGPAYLAAIARAAGHQVEVFNQDLHHLPDEALTALLDANEFDLVGVGVIGGYYQYRRLLGLAQAVNRARRRPFFVLGGHGPSPDPEYFLRRTEADAAVLGEGERTFEELLAALSSRTGLGAVAGLAWREGDKVHVNPRRPLVADVDSLPMPAFSLFPMQYYRLLRMPHAAQSDFLLPVLSGRGCTFTCAFCYRMDEGFRPRSAEGIIEEVRLLQKDYGLTYAVFSDELLMSSEARTTELCEAFLREGLRFKWSCNGRLNYAKAPLLELMKRAGCVFVNYGIEAMDDQVLRDMHKSLTTRQIVAGIQATLAAGISPGFNIIFGNIGDNRQTLQAAVEFLCKYDDGAQLRTIRPVTPYPGSPLYYRAIEQGLLKDCEDFYEYRHTNSDLLTINFTSLSDDEFHGALAQANERLLRNYYARRSEVAVQEARRMYQQRDASFRGFRQS